MTPSLRRLTAADAGLYWATRNRALQEHPDAFTTTFEEGSATPPERLAQRFGGDDSEDFVLGAFAADGTLLGYAGFEREHRAKRRHKGKIVGMYVSATARGSGLGRQLLAAVIAEARQLPGLEQLWLSVTRDNEGARQLYLRAGFTPFGVEPAALKIGDQYYDKEFMVLRFAGAPLPRPRA